MLNSRPLLSADSTPDDGVPPLTPGHFLIGRPHRAPPLRVDVTTNETNFKRWNLIRRLSADLWQRWEKDYLHKLQSCSKWKKAQPNLRVGDVILLKELDLGRRDWPMAKVIRTYQGPEDLTWVTDILCAGKVYKCPVHKLVPLVSGDPPSHHLSGEDVWA